MQSPRPEEENIIKHIRNLFRLRKIKNKQLIPQLQALVSS